MKFKIISLLAVLAVGAATFLTMTPQDSGEEKDLLFPELTAEKLNDVNSIMIKTSGQVFEIERDEDKQWSLLQAEGYPANVLKIREALTFLSEARKLEAKIAQAEYYSRLGVEDPDDEGAQSSLLEVGIADERWGVILGSVSKQSSEGQYVRKQDSEQSWLIDSRLILSDSMEDWLQTEIIHIAREDIKQITVQNAEQQTFTIDRKSKGKPLKLSPDYEVEKDLTYRVNQISGVVDYMQFKRLLPSDERELKDEEFVNADALVTYLTYQGLQITIETYKQDTETLFTVSASIADDAEPSAQTTAEAFNASNQGQIFEALNTMHTALGTGVEEIFAEL